jgi:hypothetical protein
MSDEEFLKDTWAQVMAGELLDMLADAQADPADLYDAMRAALDVYLDKAKAMEREASGAPPAVYWTPSLN